MIRWKRSVGEGVVGGFNLMTAHRLNFDTTCVTPELTAGQVNCTSNPSR